MAGHTPDLVQAFNRAVSAFRAGRLVEAEQLCQQIISAKRDFFEPLYLLAIVQTLLGQNNLAVASYDRALAVRPEHAEAHFNRGFTLQGLNRPDEALTSYNRALAIKPDYVEALYNRGVALQGLMRLDEALASFDGALSIKSDHAAALNNRGVILQRLNRPNEALASYDLALAVKPGDVETLNNRGVSLEGLKRLDEALASFDSALLIRPDYAEALNNRGIALKELNRFEEALESYDRALSVRSGDADTHYNRGASLHKLQRFDEALKSYDDALAVNADHAHAFHEAADCVLKLCDWDRQPLFAAGLEALIGNRTSIIPPFLLLGYSGDPALQLQCARNFVEHRFPTLPPPLWTGQSWRHDKIRVAYLSADFRTHATAFLMAELFELHDRERFEFTAVSFGIDDRTPMRERLVRAFDHFHDVQKHSDLEVAQLLHDRQIDIAIDLKGYTQGSRPGILAWRPAPIQASYLGYPGTMGAPFIDYIIADKFVVPFEHQPFFAEKIVHLPDSYQVNDSHRAIAASAPTRHAAGLPEQGFVFSSFNNNWKITPDVFDVWMRLLQQVEGSVLWLLRGNEGSDRNLRLGAQRRGIDPLRLIFAGRMMPEEHLARHRLADLFLDTLPYNAHTTASDALWAGLPVLTCLGHTFAARVAASLVNAARLPELIATNLDEYQALALKLAREPAQLAAIKTRLAHNRDTCFLFDSTRFARHIEAAYGTMWETWQRGEAPKSFSVEPLRA